MKKQNLSDLARLKNIEGNHFWFVGRRILINKFMQKYLETCCQNILEVGCGTGFTSKWLSEQKHCVYGIDIQSISSSTSAFFIQGNVTSLPFKNSSFDLVVALDILEHVDDQLTLSEIHRVLKPGGLLILTVPALSYLWSYRDVEAGHLRRYTLKDLSQKLLINNFNIVESKFYLFLLFPGIFFSRWLGRRFSNVCRIEEKPSRFLNKLLTQIVKLEIFFGNWISWPIGSSLAVIARCE